MLDFLLNLIFPSKCPICKQPVSKNGEICENCLPFLMNVRKINKPSAYISEFLALSNYRGGAQKIISDLKFNKKRNRLRFTDYILEKADKSIRAYPKNTLAVYVPISKKRLKERGFNQVELIFKNWLKKRNIEELNILARAKATEHQFMLTPEERMANVKDAFTATKKLSGETILLLDDILTTGATLEECAKTLKQAGAGKIFALILSSDNQ